MRIRYLVFRDMSCSYLFAMRVSQFINLVIFFSLWLINFHCLLSVTFSAVKVTRRISVLLWETVTFKMITHFIIHRNSRAIVFPWLSWSDYMIDYRGCLVSAEDVVVCLQSFCSDRDVDPFKRIQVLQTVEQVSYYAFHHLYDLFIYCCVN